MSAPTPAEVRRLWAAMSERNLGEPPPYPPMSDRIRRLVVFMERNTDDDPGPALARQYPDTTYDEFATALDIFTRQTERMQRENDETKLIVTALRLFIINEHEPLSAAFARWSAANPEAGA